AARKRFPPLDHNATRELLERLSGWDAFYVRPICARVTAPRMKQPLVQFRFIAQEQQTFRVRVEPADGVNALRETEIGQRPIRRTVQRELREDIVRLVECD